MGRVPASTSGEGLQVPRADPGQNRLPPSPQAPAVRRRPASQAGRLHCQWQAVCTQAGTSSSAVP